MTTKNKLDFMQKALIAVEKTIGEPLVSKKKTKKTKKKMVKRKK